MANTESWRVVFNEGKNEDGSQKNTNALVFKEPVEGKSYHAKEMYVLGESGGFYAPTNDEGDIPHREPSGEEGEVLGVTWHYAK
jgi:hypothetical protein